MKHPMTLFTATQEPHMTAGEYIKAGFFMCFGWFLMSFLVASFAIILWAGILVHLVHSLFLK